MALLSAILRSKDEIMMQLFFSNSNFYLDIEFEVGDDYRTPSYHSVFLYVADDNVIASTEDFNPQSSVIKFEWKENNQMWVVL